MTAFFNEKNFPALQAAATGWIGTPFIKGAAVQGAGVDCVHLVGEIYRECGFLDDYQFPNYTLDEGSHLALSKVIAWVESSGKFLLLEKTEAIQGGDLLCFQYRSAVVHHVGLAVSSSDFVHCMRRISVINAKLEDSTYKRILRGVYRPIRKEEQ